MLYYNSYYDKYELFLSNRSTVSLQPLLLWVKVTPMGVELALM